MVIDGKKYELSLLITIYTRMNYESIWMYIGYNIINIEYECVICIVLNVHTEYLKKEQKYVWIFGINSNCIKYYFNNI